MELTKWWADSLPINILIMWISGLAGVKKWVAGDREWANKLRIWADRLNFSTSPKISKNLVGLTSISIISIFLVIRIQNLVFPNNQNTLKTRQSLRSGRKRKSISPINSLTERIPTEKELDKNRNIKRILLVIWIKKSTIILANTQKEEEKNFSTKISKKQHFFLTNLFPLTPEILISLIFHSVFWTSGNWIKLPNILAKLSS